MPSLHERCQEAVADRIRALSLPDVDPDRVYGRLLPDDADTTFPAVLVTVEGETEELEALGTELDSKVLPVRVKIRDRTSANYEANRERFLAWREQLTSAFLCQRLTDAVAENYGLDVRTEPVVERSRDEYQVLESSFVVRCLCATDRA